MRKIRPNKDFLGYDQFMAIAQRSMNIIYWAFPRKYTIYIAQSENTQLILSASLFGYEDAARIHFYINKKLLMSVCGFIRGPYERTTSKLRQLMDEFVSMDLPMDDDFIMYVSKKLV